MATLKDTYIAGQLQVEGPITCESLEIPGNLEVASVSTSLSSKATWLAKFVSDSTNELTKSLISEVGTTISVSGGLDVASAARFIDTTASTSVTTGAVTISGGLGVEGDIYANKVFGAVWNDVAEFMFFKERSEPGDVLVMTADGVCKSQKRGDKATVGIHSDTFGYALGSQNHKEKTPIGLTGRVLVKIKDKCKIGDVLISGPDGIAVKRRWYEIFKREIGIVMVNKNNNNLERIEVLIK